MIKLMIDLARGLFIIFVFLALIYKFVVVVDRYRKAEADIAARYGTEQMATE